MVDMTDMEKNLEEAAEEFLRFNSEDLNEFQVDTIRVVFSADSGPDEYARLLVDMDREVRLLESIQFRPYATRGDKVVRPQHYDQFAIEPTYFNMANSVDWCRGNILKYISRYRHKNGIEDIRKAARYLEMFIKFLDGDPMWSK